MATPRVSRLRPLLVLAFFLAAWWLVPVAVRSFSRASFSLFEAPGLITYSRLKDLQDYWSLRDQGQTALITAGHDLARHANDSDLQLQQAESWRDDNQRLEDALAMPREPGFRYEFARVTLREESTWWQQVLINKGRHDGIEPGQGVVFVGGVVGRVSQRVDDVGEFTAVVDLSCNPSFRVDANLGQDVSPVIYQGIETAPFHAPSGEVRNVPPALILYPGNPLPLVTSGLGGVFPQGLALGTVERLQPGSDGLFQTGVVKLDPRLTSLHEVAVLVPKAPTPAAAPLPQASLRQSTAAPRRPAANP